MENIKDLYRKYHEQIAYVFYGGLTTAVNFLTFGLLADLLCIDEMAAQLIAWFASVLLAFVTTSFWASSAHGRCPAWSRTAASGSLPIGWGTTIISSSWCWPSLSSSPIMCCPNS